MPWRKRSRVLLTSNESLSSPETRKQTNAPRLQDLSAASPRGARLRGYAVSKFCYSWKIVLGFALNASESRASARVAHPSKPCPADHTAVWSACCSSICVWLVDQLKRQGIAGITVSSASGCANSTLCSATCADGFVFKPVVLYPSFDKTRKQDSSGLIRDSKDESKHS